MLASVGLKYFCYPPFHKTLKNRIEYTQCFGSDPSRNDVDTFPIPAMAEFTILHQICYFLAMHMALEMKLSAADGVFYIRQVMRRTLLVALVAHFYDAAIGIFFF